MTTSHNQFNTKLHKSYLHNGLCITTHVEAEQLVLTYTPTDTTENELTIPYVCNDTNAVIDFVGELDLLEVFASIDALFTTNPKIQTVTLAKSDSFQVEDVNVHASKHGDFAQLELVTNAQTNVLGLELWALANNENYSWVTRELFYQTPFLHIQKSTVTNAPSVLLMHNAKYAPMRPQKPRGVVYKRYIPWLQQTLSFETFDKTKHLQLFHNWMNDKVVDEFWEEAGSLEKHEAYIDMRHAHDSHTVCVIACLDGTPFGYMEVYWASEDRIAPYYDVQAFDRGWHILIGEESFRGKEFLTAWMPSISHYMLLDDSRTQRIVIEPRIDNEKMKRSLGKCGYAHYKTFDFPHKTAMLGMLQREQFFAYDVLTPLTK